MQTPDIVIVGAGWHGLAMAKTYLEVCPQDDMLVLDSASTVGGTWAKERLYPGLKTNNIVGSYEFSDFPMLEEKFGVAAGQHIPGEVVHEYLCQFVQHFKLASRLRLNQRVMSAELLEDGEWLLQTDQESIRTRRLVVATGLTSEPFIPSIPGSETFGGNFFHAKQLRDRADDLKEAQDITILGGNKSALDACYYAANLGAHVNLIIRPGGGGPSWVWPVLLPLQISVQRLASTRFFTWLDPCIWAEDNGVISWVRFMLHRTLLGRRIVFEFWRLIGRLILQAHRYDQHPETQKLKPWASPFWSGNSLSTHNYKTPWFDLVREGKISVHIQDIESLSQGTVHLSNGVRLKADALVCCTGWKTKSPIKILPESMELCATSDIATFTDEARSEIYAKLPALQTLPPRLYHPAKQSSFAHRYELYRFMVPSKEKFLAQRSVVFIGAHLALTAIPVAQLQALWATAFLMDEISNLKSGSVDLKRVRYETTLHNEYTRIRHPHSVGGSGDRCPDLTFDCLSYIDLLESDLGLPRYRKKGILSETFHRYGASDFRGIVQEWLHQKKSSREERA